LSSPIRLGTYALVALFGVFELGVLWLVAHPDVPPNYRAYYIDHTTTCLDQPVSGAYAGGVVCFLPGGADQAKPLKVCGWEGPVGDGTHAVGTSARLRFVTGTAFADPVLTLELIAVAKDGLPSQRVEVLLNDQLIDVITVSSRDAETFALPIPADVLATSAGRYDLTLRFPEAIKMGATDPQTRWRSIKLLAAGITERADPSAQMPAAL